MKRFDPYPFTGVSQGGQMISVSAEREFSGHHYFAYERPAGQAPSPRADSHWPSPPPGFIPIANERSNSASSSQAGRAQVALPNLPKPLSLELLKNKTVTSDPETSPYGGDDADRQSAIERAANNSLAMLYHLRPTVPPSAGFAVLKVSNIAWNLSISDIVSFFAPFVIPVGHAGPYFTQAVHIIMNRATGKTQSECFVEFPTYTDAQRALELHGRGVLKGRIVVTQWSTQAELADALFPHRAGHSKEPNVMEHDAGQDDGDSGLIYDHNLSAPATDGVFLLREEINALLLVCRNYKLHFSRKCAERPFENIISILAKVPWHHPEAVSTAHRDHLFEMLKLSLESLRIHLSRSDHQIDETLMARMVRAGLCVPLFTERQKVTLLNVTQMPCSPDLARFVYNPPQMERSFSATEDSYEPQSAPADLLATQVAQVNLSSRSAESNKVMQSPAGEDQHFADDAKYLTPVAGGYSHKTFAQATSAAGVSLYPSPPDGDAPSTPTPYGNQSRAGNIGIAPGTLLTDRFECDTPNMTASLYASRIRLLEQALRQSEGRYQDLCKRHEAALTRANRERQEIINGKLCTEQHCEDLEREYHTMEEENTALRRQCAALEQRLSGGSGTPTSEFGRDFPYLTYGHAASANRTSHADRLNSDTVRNIWN
ncbi:hypothetical protein HDU86_005700 [Geranomyces michiganensis]|nr:hypothetical protein HDU86_005700 [Geranomyces michiganensis]